MLACGTLVEHARVEGCFDLLRVVIQLVTSANHLVGVDLMVLSGVGGCCVLLCGCGLARG